MLLRSADLTLTSRFFPGLMAMQLVVLFGLLSQVSKSKKLKKETDQALREFDNKKINGTAAPNASVTNTSNSIETRSSRGIMFNMESLQTCLDNKTSDFESFRRFCAERCLCSENVTFLEKAISFKREWARIFSVPGQNLENVRLTMYRVAVNIYLTLINDDTAKYAINIEGSIKNELHSLFRAVAISIAARRPSTPKSPNAAVTPWDEPADPFNNLGNDHPLRPLTRHSIDKGSSTDLIAEIDVFDPDDPFADLPIPVHFDSACLDRAMASVKHMLWQQPWQEYMRSKRGSAASA